MQLANKATLLAALAITVSSPLMLIDTVGAVEVSGVAAPLLPASNVSGQPSFASSRHGSERGWQPAVQVTEATAQDTFILGSRSFTIPFTVDGDASDSVEVQLFVSRGSGDVWAKVDAKRPLDLAVRQFTFTAAEDGQYWFATRTTRLSDDSTLAPSVAPQLKVLIDTTKPILELQAEADADGRVETWLTFHDATEPKSMRLRYVTDAIGTWQDVSVEPLPQDGRIQFVPTGSWEQLSLQFVATDTAGNQTAASKLLHRPRVASAPDHRYSAAPLPKDTRSSDTLAGDALKASQAPYRIDSLGTEAFTVSGPNLPRSTVPADPSNASQRPVPTLANRAGSALGAFRGAAFPQTKIPAGPATPMTPQAATQVLPPPSAANPLDKLFGNQAPVFQSLPSPASQGIGTQARPPVDAPSIYGNFAPSDTGGSPPSYRTPSSPPENILPPPATADQISNGFGLHGPDLATGNPAKAPLAHSGPETVATPSASESELKRKNRTLSEAMMPLSKPSAVPEKADESSERTEQIATPKAKPDRYRAARSNPIDQRVPVRYSNSQRFSLEYELEAVGSQGTEAIELYGSVDEGKTWKLWGRDPDRVSPFDIEVREQGVFGYRIVVVGRNGLASPRPFDGDAPDIVVVVDEESPTVRISGATYGEGDRIGALVIAYQCSDPNLMARPITLSFSESLDGPWTTIAAGLRNDGDYVWPADPQLPRQFFLRIDATDQAGNVGTYILDTPIDAQGLAPRARIRGFQSLSGVTPPAAAEQTAKRPIEKKLK